MSTPSRYLAPWVTIALCALGVALLLVSAHVTDPATQRTLLDAALYLTGLGALLSGLALVLLQLELDELPARPSIWQRIRYAIHRAL